LPNFIASTSDFCNAAPTINLIEPLFSIKGAIPLAATANALEEKKPVNIIFFDFCKDENIEII